MRKSVIIILAVAALLVSSLAGGVLAAEKATMKKFPDLKLGFTTVNFVKPLPVNVANIKKIIDFAADAGFSWIELRDPMAGLKKAECEELAAYAKGKKIQVAYALNVGILDGKFEEVFALGLANAAVFDGPKTLRTAIGGPEFAADPKKTAWTAAELAELVKRADKAAGLAKAGGLKHVIENAFETLKGDGQASFGTTELFAKVGKDVGYQLDTGNFFVVSRTPAKPEEAKALVESLAARMAYIHLKAGVGGKTLPVLADGNPMPFDWVFGLMSKNKIPWVALELDQAATFEECAANHKKSLEYLVSKY